MPTRNENSVAAIRLVPSIMAKIIVAPDREAPGKTAATNCASATTMTTAHEISSVLSRPFIRVSTTRKSTPPTIRAAATG